MNEELLATLIEVFDYGNRLQHVVYFKAPHPEPLEITRPNRPKKRTRAKKARMSSPQEIRAFFQRGRRVKGRN